VTSAQVRVASGCEEWLRSARTRWSGPSSVAHPRPTRTSPATGNNSLDRTCITNDLPTENPTTAAGQVADLLDPVYEANARTGAEVGHLVGSSLAVSQTADDRFLGLSVDPPTGATARAALSVLDSELLLAGVFVWLSRRRAGGDTPAAGTVLHWPTGMSA
jgi:hypothetical protein